jgi:hypothetical protein
VKIFCSLPTGRRRKTLTLILLLLAVVAVGRAAFFPTSAVEDVSAALSAVPKKTPAKTEEQRQELIASLGWEVSPDPVEIVTVTIPSTFDDVYTAYNELQLSQGLDLTRYRGKTCTRYTYSVQNHPRQSDDVRLNLLVCKGRVIGGDVCSLGLDGFQQSLLFPQDGELQEESAAGVNLQNT